MVNVKKSQWLSMGQVRARIEDIDILENTSQKVVYSIDMYASVVRFLQLQQTIYLVGSWLDEDLSPKIAEYEAFMRYRAAGREPFTPTPQVLKVWHTHLLRTVEYEDYCLDVLGTEYVITDDGLFGSDFASQEDQDELLAEFKSETCTFNTPYSWVTDDEIWYPTLMTVWGIADYPENWETFLEIKPCLRGEIRDSIKGYELFMYLSAKYSQEMNDVGPPITIDLTWHTHQVHSQIYRNDCTHWMEYVPAHRPRTDEPTTEVTEFTSRDNRWNEMVELLRKEYRENYAAKHVQD
eukprot:TRINITY_DN11819_c0_g1_i1.p1 TRINITY_DN11819_c0_g1~~TRINITY_DN11819_c0_g1_i1.p1  ORF type:complete len:294 (-),score=61.68 TRINITY_DN11819_c0_g1_i1:112-993(-)